MNLKHIAAASAAISLLPMHLVAKEKKQDARPNILLMLVDDIGYSDFSCFGSEIPTPNIDRLSAMGITYTQFYNCGRSCPTRASLLTGLYPHQTGIGEMTESPSYRPKEDSRYPGYQYYLNHNCITIAELLREEGYHTWMSGKWHLGMYGKEKMPLSRGFERFYGILTGTTSYFQPHTEWSLWEGFEKLPAQEEGFYTTDAFTTRAIEYMSEREDDKPFFMYLAYNAAHWPLHAKQEDIDRFAGVYDKGWDQIREDRWHRMLERGLVKEEWEMAGWESRHWDELTAEEKHDRAVRMSVYAAQVSCLDQNIGRVLDYLESSGQLSNTIIFFLSDNGASAEPHTEQGFGSIEDINDPSSHKGPSYGLPWAQVSNTPFRKYKIRAYEGGISTPMMVCWQDRFASKAGERRDAVSILPDIMATIIDATGCKYPSEYKGNKIHPLEGVSLLGSMSCKWKRNHSYVYGEHYDNRYVRHGRWKAVWDQECKRWELYDIKNDRTERHDLSDRQRRRVERLSARWDEWAASHDVWPKREKKKKR